MAIPWRAVVLSALHRFKEIGAALETTLPLLQDRRVVGRLEPVGWADAERAETTALLAGWREKAGMFFPSPYPVTLDGARRWLVQGLLEAPDRLLFWVKTASGRPVGHIGLFAFDNDHKSVEIDHIVRGEEGVLPGVMQTAIDALLGWSFAALGADAAFLRVTCDNQRALQLCRRLGFQETARVLLRREQDGAVAHGVETAAPSGAPVERFLVTMRLSRSEWRAVGPRAVA